MQFLRVVFVALAFVLAVFGATTTPTVQIGPCIDAAGTAICRNVAKDCDSIRFRKLLREQCQATCGYC
uniref:ShKT domain-containing protein n=1 Tax=Panagrellus redivivus TaxID=6233 RepID=A0A7E4W8U0_PANRE